MATDSAAAAAVAGPAMDEEAQVWVCHQHGDSHSKTTSTDLGWRALLSIWAA